MNDLSLLEMGVACLGIAAMCLFYKRNFNFPCRLPRVLTISCKGKEHMANVINEHNSDHDFDRLYTNRQYCRSE